MDPISSLGDGKEEPQPECFEFVVKAKTVEEENEYDCVKERRNEHPVPTVGAIAHMVKGALGAGILTLHEGYMRAGWVLALAFHVSIAFYMSHNLDILVRSANILYKRLKVPSLTYSDVGEAAFISTGIPCIMRCAKLMRYIIDICICIDLFGSCATYQIIIAKSIKQLVEDRPNTTMSSAIPDFPFLTLRFYIAIVCIPCVIICLLRHLSWLAYFSIAANGTVVLCIITTLYYASKSGHSFSDMTPVKDFEGFFIFAGISVFSMSCAGIVLPVENSMAHPNQFRFALFCGMGFITCATIITALFGYLAYLEDCESPITINFPMETLPKLLKIAMAFMIYVTHALNFWVPFNITFYYIKKRIPPQKQIFWERFYRGTIVVIINSVAVIFPDIVALIGVLGCMCLANMAFIWPNMVDMCVRYQHPGYGPFKIVLIKDILFMAIGYFLLVAGTFINAKQLINAFTKATTD